MIVRAYISVILLTAWSSPSRADDTEASIQVVASKDPKIPQLEVRLANAGPLKPGSLTLTMPADPKLAIRAASVQDFKHGAETLALALVVSGQEIWIGNDDIEKDDAAKHVGALKSLTAAIDKAKLGAIGPAGSEAVVISYSQGATVKLPMGKLDRLTGRVLGSQKDYRAKLANDLVQGVTAGLTELRKSTAAHKALIVIGDGNDTNFDTAKAQLLQLRKDALTAGVRLYGIVYKSEISDERTVITSLIPPTKTIRSAAGFADELSAIASKVADHGVAVFPGAGLPWDGKPHDLVVKVGAVTLDPISVVLAPPK